MSRLSPEPPVKVINVRSLNSSVPWLSPVEFDVTFTISPPGLGLNQALQFKLFYAPSLSIHSVDQEIEDVDVGPVAIGLNRFILTATLPDLALVPMADLLETAVVVIKGLYRDQVFFSCSFQVEKICNQDKSWRQYKRKMEQRELAEQKQAARQKREGMQRQRDEEEAADDPTAPPRPPRRQFLPIVIPPMPANPQIDIASIGRDIYQLGATVNDIDWKEEEKKDDDERASSTPPVPMSSSLHGDAVMAPILPRLPPSSLQPSSSTHPKEDALPRRKKVKLEHTQPTGMNSSFSSSSSSAWEVGDGRSLAETGDEIQQKLVRVRQEQANAEREMVRLSEDFEREMGFLKVRLAHLQRSAEELITKAKEWAVVLSE